MFKVSNKNIRQTSLTSSWCFYYCSLWTYFTSFSGVSIVEFEQANVSLGYCLHISGQSSHFVPHENTSLPSPVDNYMFKVNNKNTRARYEICSKLTIKTPERSHWRQSGVFVVNFEHTSHHVVVFLFLTLSR